jgi:GNAT superfamily N-acetyltransferase
MDRVAGPKCAVLARSGDRSAGVAFVGVAGGEAMVHALHVLPAFRRRGSAANIMRAAALWAAEQGAGRLSLAVTQANEAANSLYAFLGMPIVGQYHYRLR